MRGTMAHLSSLLQTDTAEMAHREHQHQRFHSHQYLHQDRPLKRRSEGTPTDGQPSPVSTVTEVTQTVSVIQQVEVDSNGSTIAIYTVQETSPPIALTDVIATETAAPSTTAADSVSPAVKTGSSTPQVVPLTVNSTSSSAPVASSSTFTSLLSSTGNSTTSTGPASSLSSTNHFSSATPAISTASATITSSSQSSSWTGYPGPMQSVLTYTSFSDGASPTIYPSGNGGVSTVSSDIGGTGGAGSSSAATSTAAVVASGLGVNPAPPASTIAGGVVGGVAGVAIIIFLFMFILRYKQRSHPHIPIGSAPPGSNAEASRGLAGSGGPSSSPGIMGMSMTERSLPFAIPAALASLTGYKKRGQDPHHSVAASSTAASEKGFYRVSGRKLQNVLQSGGDGYGDTNSISDLPGAQFNQEHLSNASFYRDSRGFYGGPGAPSPLNLGNRPIRSRDGGVVVNRPSPARTPVISESPFADHHEIPGTGSPIETPPFIRADRIGRSHPSQDGSHGSKFTEEV